MQQLLRAFMKDFCLICLHLLVLNRDYFSAYYDRLWRGRFPCMGGGKC